MMIATTLTKPKLSQDMWVTEHSTTTDTVAQSSFAITRVYSHRPMAIGQWVTCEALQMRDVSPQQAPEIMRLRGRSGRSTRPRDEERQRIYHRAYRQPSY